MVEPVDHPDGFCPLEPENRGVGLASEPAVRLERAPVDDLGDRTPAGDGR